MVISPFSLIATPVVVGYLVQCGNKLLRSAVRAIVRAIGSATRTNGVDGIDSPI